MVECNQCHAATVVFDGGNVHDALKCACCPEDHNHGEAASAEGAVPCRPVTVYAQAVVKPGGGA